MKIKSLLRTKNAVFVLCFIYNRNFKFDFIYLFSNPCCFSEFVFCKTMIMISGHRIRYNKEIDLFAFIIPYIGLVVP